MMFQNSRRHHDPAKNTQGDPDENNIKNIYPFEVFAVACFIGICLLHLRGKRAISNK